MLGAIFLQYRTRKRCDRLALTDDIQRHPLAHFALGVAVGDEGLVAVRVHVDETRRDHISLG